jgi:hypothetical protein
MHGLAAGGMATDSNANTAVLQLQAALLEAQEMIKQQQVSMAEASSRYEAMQQQIRALQGVTTAAADAESSMANPRTEDQVMQDSLLQGNAEATPNLENPADGEKGTGKGKGLGNENY